MKNTRMVFSIALAILCTTGSSFALSLHDMKPSYWKASASVPNPTGSSALERYAYNQMSQSTKVLYNQWMTDTKKALKLQKPRFPFELGISTSYGLCNDHVVSGMRILTSETGGAHPIAVYKAYSYGVVKGAPKQLILRDILAQGVTPDTIATEVLLPALNEMKVVRGGEAVSSLTASQLNSIVVTSKGINWVFGPYEVGPWVEGDYIVKIPWTKLRRYLNPNGPIGTLLKK